MNSDSFKPRRNIEQQFASDVLSYVSRVLNAPATGGVPAHLLNDFSFLDQWAWQAASRMVTGLLTLGQRTWRNAASASGQGSRIYAALQHELHGPVGRRARQLIAENALLIRSLPEEVRVNVARRVAREEYAGERAEAIEELIPHVTRVKARLIARTETSKASTALTRARAENLGLQWYVWRTSKDQRVRPSHKLMNGVLVAFTDAPSPEALLGIKSTLGFYNAGDAPNCRCYVEPLIHLGQVGWPHRAYYGGRIQAVTLAKFRTLANLPFSTQLKEAA